MQQATVNLFADMGVQPGDAAGRARRPRPRRPTPTAPTVDDHRAGDGATVPPASPVTITGTATTPAAAGRRRRGLDRRRHDVAPGERPRQLDLHVHAAGDRAPLTIRSRATDDSGNTGAASPAVTITVAAGCPCSLVGRHARRPRIRRQQRRPADRDGGNVPQRRRRLDHRDSASTRARRTPARTSATSGPTTARCSRRDVHAARPRRAGSRSTLDSPVAITANTTYVASYFTPVGLLRRRRRPTSRARVSTTRRCTRLQDGVDGANGVYHYGARRVPDHDLQRTATTGSTSCSRPGPDTTPPVVTSATPAPARRTSRSTPRCAPPSARPMDPATITRSTFSCATRRTRSCPRPSPTTPAARTATLTPTAALAPSATYTAHGARRCRRRGGPRRQRARGRRRLVVHDARAPPADDGPGGPILVVASTSNPFGRYYAEILRAEGLNEFRVTDISLVTPAMLGRTTSSSSARCR